MQYLEEKVESPYQVTDLPREEVMERIYSLDLDCVKFKLMDSKEGPGWSRDKAEMVETHYKRFLYMSVTEGTSIVPTKDIDAFWHNHILDTHKYASDCENSFWFFLHHFPYLGMRGEEDVKRLQSSFENTRRVYERQFGEMYGTDANDCENCGNCTSSCGVCDSSGSRSSEGSGLRPTLPSLEDE